MGNFIFGDVNEYFKDYPDNYFDLAFADVEYGIGEDGRKERPTSVKQKNGSVLTFKRNYVDEIWDNEPPPQSYFDELFRVSKYQIICGTNHFYFDQQKTSSGRIIWDKVNGKNDFSDCEIFWTNLFSSVRQIAYMWHGMMQGKSIEEGRVQQGNKKLNEKRIQATQKPVLLYRWLLNLPQVKKDWKILDTHVGSASSLIACEIEGFDYVGYEKLSSHYERSDLRLKTHINKYMPAKAIKWKPQKQMRLI